MNTLCKIKETQKSFIDECTFKTKRFINSLELDNIDTILLSGSVARGDFLPGKFGGMIDLTIIKKRDSSITAEKLFGKDEEPDIPYHCIKHMGQGFQIAFHNYISDSVFYEFNETKKYALLESTILYDDKNSFKIQLDKINSKLTNLLKIETDNLISYIHYLISDYKKDRWIIRRAYPQLHANLDTAIHQAIKCLFYINGKYSPAEDRMLYYSYDLDIKPANYDKVIQGIFNRDVTSFIDYNRREKIFNKILLPIIMAYK